MQSLVLGASGVVGGHILRQLQRTELMPFALSRTERPSQDNVRWFQGDLSDPATLNVPPASVIYCTAHAALLHNALPRLVTNDLQRIVLFTSTSTITKINSDIASERESLRKLLDGEKQTIAACENYGIDWTVLRPTLIYDEWRDVNVSRLAGMIARFGFIPLSGRGLGLRQPVHAEDLAIGALQAASSEAARNRGYELPGGDTITFREMVGRIFDGMNRPRRIVSVPPPVWRSAFSLVRFLLPNANVAMGERMAKDMTFDSQRATADFGWHPRGFKPRFDRT